MKFTFFERCLGCLLRNDCGPRFRPRGPRALGPHPRLPSGCVPLLRRQGGPVVARGGPGPGVPPRRMESSEADSEVRCRGALELLRRARVNGAPWDRHTCAAAAEGGHLELLQWLRTQSRCPWDVWTCADAASFGRLEVLQWARAQEPPCPWDLFTCAYAALGGHLELLRWARPKPALPVGRFHLHQCRREWPPGAPAMGTRPESALPVGRGHLRQRRQLWPS
jgi:hypothetical protein